jgi:hypothetical protein
VDIIEKKAVIAASNSEEVNSFWNGAFPWNTLLSSFQNKTVIYISPTHYIDTETLEFVQYFMPNDTFDYIRAPYSNNEMPYAGNMLVNIETNKHQSIDPEGYFRYGMFFLDSDRRYVSSRLDTPEYSIIVESGWLMFYMGKNHTGFGSYNFEIGETTSEVENRLLQEFTGTIFDTPFWLETFRNLLSNTNIITKYGLVFDYYDGRKNLFEKIGTYFQIDTSTLFNLEYQLYDSDYKLNIYADGFYSYNTEKIIVFNIKNNSVTSYDITDCNISSDYEYYPWEIFNRFEILSQGNYFYVLSGEENNANALSVYKLSMD